jgi:hypothetical protein
LGNRDRTTDIVLYDGDYGFAMNIVKNLYLGPGEPGPGDEWKIPTGPIDLEVQDEAIPEPEHSSHGGSLLRRLTHRG